MVSFPVSQCSALQHRLSRRPTSSCEGDIVARDHVIARTVWHLLQCLQVLNVSGIFF